MWAYCRDCHHERDVNPATVPLPPETPAPEIGKRMKCSNCGSRNVTTALELYPGGIEAMRARRNQPLSSGVHMGVAGWG